MQIFIKREGTRLVLVGDAASPSRLSISMIQAVMIEGTAPVGDPTPLLDLESEIKKQEAKQEAARKRNEKLRRDAQKAERRRKR